MEMDATVIQLEWLEFRQKYRHYFYLLAMYTMSKNVHSLIHSGNWTNIHNFAKQYILIIIASKVFITLHQTDHAYRLL